MAENKVGTVALVLVDEVHTIGEERGATLEVILTRMKMVSRSAEVRAAASVPDEPTHTWSTVSC